MASKPESKESFPFGDDAAVFKVRGKMFGLYSIYRTGEPIMNLKCHPDQALALRDVFEEVFPAYHMNKKHWNSVILSGSVPQPELERMIDHSYALVVKGLPKKDRNALISLYGEGILLA
jgi:predicted DNA-binding protein (MmcQ/YjbR family)